MAAQATFLIELWKDLPLTLPISQDIPKMKRIGDASKSADKLQDKSKEGTT